VAFVRRVLADPPNPPRWPMYPRQFKQFLRAADPSFEENRFGSIADLMRACQKDGLLRLERDRQGGLRVFASTGVPAASVPLGWSMGRASAPDVAPELIEVEPAPEPVASESTAGETAPVVEAEVLAAPAVAPPASSRPRRPRARKAAGDRKPRGKKKAAVQKTG
jgi:hypothetical protein